jgi:hypothetical protein
LANFAGTPLRVGRTPANREVREQERVGVRAEFMAPNADFRVEMQRWLIVDPERG